MEFFDYQMEGADWLRYNPKSILGDSMGLGKTAQIGYVLWATTWSDDPNNSVVYPVLIVGPSILAYHWQDELKPLFLDVQVAVGTKAADVDAVATGKIVYVNYEKFNVKRFNDVLQSRQWNTVIVDESHKVRGYKAKRSKELVRLCQAARRIHFLTGTPYPQGSPADVFVALSAFDGGIRGRGFWSYIRKWCATGTVEIGGNAWMDVGPAKSPQEFSGMMSQWMLRRTRKDVGRQLPPLLRTTIRHSPSPRQKTLYRSMVKGMSFVTKAGETVEAQNTAVQWQRLRELCVSPRLFDTSEDLGSKIDAIGEILEQAHAAGRKVVIFTWHRHVARLLAETIDLAYTPSCYFIVGGMGAEDASDEAKHFNSEPGFAVLIGTIAAMGTGLNLQAATVAIFAEISYVPDENEQALARLHREGQDNTVNAYYFVARGTIEEYIREQVLVKQINISKLLNEHAMAQEMIRLGGV
jgi:SWI/SNF-related matrix-associated actin-dependent regulator 1 of chromatin subfamily A